MSRPAWVEELPPDEYQLVKDQRVRLVLKPTRRELCLERLAYVLWWLGLNCLGDRVDQRRSDRQWERARWEVGCSG